MNVTVFILLCVTHQPAFGTCTLDFLHVDVLARQCTACSILIAAIPSADLTLCWRTCRAVPLCLLLANTALEALDSDAIASIVALVHFSKFSGDKLVFYPKEQCIISHNRDIE